MPVIFLGPFGSLTIGNPIRLGCPCLSQRFFRRAVCVWQRVSATRQMGISSKRHDDAGKGQTAKSNQSEKNEMYRERERKDDRRRLQFSMCVIQQRKKVIVLNCVLAWVKQTHYFIQTNWKVLCQMTIEFRFCSINLIVFIISTITFSATKPKLFSNFILTDVPDLTTIAHTISQKWPNAK